MTDLLLDSPVGTPEERATLQLWPGAWFDAMGYDVPYPPAMHRADYHTGADLNLNEPYWNADAHAPFYSICDGAVVAAGLYPVWGKIIVVKHELAPAWLFWSRYAHCENILVNVGQAVARGDMLGHIGNAEGRFAWHLHFDIAIINLGLHPTDWPNTDRARLERDYLNPLVFIREHHIATSFQPYTARITADPNLRIRKEPNTNSDVVGHINRGEVVTIIQVQSGWGWIDKPIAGWIWLFYTEHVA